MRFVIKEEVIKMVLPFVKGKTLYVMEDSSSSDFLTKPRKSRGRWVIDSGKGLSDYTCLLQKCYMWLKIHLHPRLAQGIGR